MKKLKLNTIPYIFTCLIFVIGLLVFHSQAFMSQNLPLKNISGQDHFEVIAASYHLVVDLSEDGLKLYTPGKAEELATLSPATIWQGGIQYTADFQNFKPDLHVLRMGSFMTQFHLENIVFTNENEHWKGLGELSFYCYCDRVFLVSDYICNNAEWIVRDDGKYIYPARAGFTNCSTQSPEKISMSLNFEADNVFAAVETNKDVLITENLPLSVMPSFNAEENLISSDANTVFLESSISQPWLSGEIHELGAAIVFGENSESVIAKTDAISHPLTSSNFQMEPNFGSFLEYYARAGIYRFIGLSTPTPLPAPGYIGGCQFTILNDDRTRSIMIDQRDAWGGIAGGILSKKNSQPLPVTVQFDLNYPEKSLNGEKSGSAMIFPVELKASESKYIAANTLFNQLTNRDLIFLNSLEASDNTAPGIFQVSINRYESHSTRQNPFCITDFRPHQNDLEGQSASASNISYLKYFNQSGEEINLQSGAYEIIETGPGLIEYRLDLESQDKKVKGKGHFFQFANSDYTRIFCDIDLEFIETVNLNANITPRFNIMRFDVGNPMVYLKYAYKNQYEQTSIGNLTNVGTGTLALNKAKISNPFFFSMYEASNSGGTEPGLTISDRAGNPLMVVYDWNTNINGEPMTPAATAFASGAANPDGAYHRYLAVVPAQTYSSIEAGSEIHFKMMQMTGGDEFTSHKMAEDEFEYWPKMSAEAQLGEVISQFPIHIKAINDQAYFIIKGGYNRVPVKVSGFQTMEGLWAFTSKNGEHTPIYSGDSKDPWYNTWIAEDGSYGVTFLVDKSDGNTDVNVLLTTSEPDQTFFDLVTVEEIQNQPKISVYPNPVKDFLWLNYSQPSSLFLYNTMGKLVKYKELKGEKKIAMNLPPGLYLLCLKSSTGEIIHSESLIHI